jgi:hypothetical protein
MFRRLAAALVLRRLSRDLTAIAGALQQQNALLTRLADHFAPVQPLTTRPEVQADTGVTHLDADEAAAALAYVTRTARDTGHMPDDDEILVHLADEKTQVLAERLSTRDAELRRLRELREW